MTNVLRLKKGIDMGAANGLLLKLNQIGTVSEAFDAAEMAFRNKYRVAVSHRSGETNDDIIADVAVALGVEYSKTGAPHGASGRRNTTSCSASKKSSGEQPGPRSCSSPGSYCRRVPARLLFLFV